VSSPGFGIPAIVNYGNGGSSGGEPPAIDHRIYIGGPVNFGAPSLANVRKIPIIEKITPRRVNATDTISRIRSRAIVTVGTGTRRIADRTMATSRALAMRARSITPR
jgi:hypothetical protein